MVQRTILPIVVACTVAVMGAGCTSKGVTSGGQASGGLGSLVPWGKPTPESQGISKYTYEHQQRSVVSPALGLEDKSQSGMAKLAAALSPSAVGKKVSSAFQRDGEEPPRADEPKKSTSGKTTDKKPQPSADLYVAGARLAERAGNPTGATAQYENALKADPNHRDALLGYARMLDRQGQLSKATQLYLKATKANPKDAGAFNDLGLCYARQGMFVDSAAALSEAVDLQPDRDLYRNNIATVLVELGRAEEAISHLSAVHGEAIAHYNVGYLLNNHGDTKGAAEQFALAVKVNPNFVEARRWLDDLNGRLAASGEAPAAAPVSMNRQPQRTAEPLLPRARKSNDPGVAPRFTSQPQSMSSTAVPLDGSASAGSLPGGSLPASRPRVQPAKSQPTMSQPNMSTQPGMSPAGQLPRAGLPRQALPPVSVPAWPQNENMDGPAIPPTPEQVRQESTVDPGTGYIDTPPSIRSLPPASSAYYPSSRY